MKTNIELNQQLDTLYQLTHQVIDSDREAHWWLLQNLANDQVGEQGETLLGLRRAPAAKGNHHAHEGGLVQHLLEMWDFWMLISTKLKTGPELNDERVLKAILYHDIHKAYRTFKVESQDPWKAQYVDSFYAETFNAGALTWGTKSLWLLGQHGVKLDELQVNALLWSEGGWSTTKPKSCSALAKVAYLLDELSGNVLARVNTDQFTWLSKHT